MNKKGLFISIIFTILLSVFVFLVGFGEKKNINAVQKLYQVYLSGEKVGVINNEEEFYELINEQQKELKEKFRVSNIYPPKGLEVSSMVTYKNKVNSIKEIYEYIKDKEPFTIKGYEVTIKKEKPIIFYVLNKDILDEAVRNTVEVFMDKEQLKKYLEGTQEEIKDEGTLIEKLFLEEDVVVKNTLISTEEKIFTDVDELSKYMIFGTLEEQKSYTVKLGDTIESVSDKNKLNVEEFLIANPNIVSENALLYPGQKVNIGLIKPVINVAVESISVENQVVKYETTIEYDNRMATGTKYVKQKGVNGRSKTTFKLNSVNGEVLSVDRIKTEEISSPIDQIVVMGGYDVIYVGDSTYWAWPTVRTYYISSPYGWRKHEFHEGVDIAGIGLKSNIYSIQNGIVEKTGFHSTMGNYIYINHNNGYYSVYMHLSKIIIAEGATVMKGQTIGLAGSTGRSTGVHLHLGIFVNGYPYTKSSNTINPLLLYK